MLQKLESLEQEVFISFSSAIKFRQSLGSKVQRFVVRISAKPEIFQTWPQVRKVLPPICKLSRFSRWNRSSKPFLIRIMAWSSMLLFIERGYRMVHFTAGLRSSPVLKSIFAETQLAHELPKNTFRQLPWQWTTTSPDGKSLVVFWYLPSAAAWLDFLGSDFGLNRGQTGHIGLLVVLATLYKSCMESWCPDPRFASLSGTISTFSQV